MRAVLLIFALRFVAAAQTKMTGVPERGVILTGDLTHPTLENHSGKTILVAHTFQVHANGQTHDAGGFFYCLPVVTTAELGRELLSYAARVIPGLSDSPVASTELLNVVFYDGEVSGRDDKT